MNKRYILAITLAAALRISTQAQPANRSGFGPEQLVTDQLAIPISVVTADLDGDGDADVITADYLYPNAKVVWYANDGQGNFGTSQLIAQAGYVRVIYAADLDGDGDQDVLSASISPQTGLTWYKNDGQGNFSVAQTITGPDSNATSVFVADIDGDGDSDIVATPRTYLREEYNFDERISWYPNDGEGSFSAEQVIASNAYSPRDVYAADLDGDGDQDVVIALSLGNEISWYANDGQGNFTLSQVISRQANYVTSVAAVDLDGDGDQDIIASALGTGDKLVWYQNNGQGRFDAQRVVSDQASGAYDAYPTDLDSDGNPDIISAFRNKVTWHKNVINSTIPSINGFALIDARTDRAVQRLEDEDVVDLDVVRGGQFVPLLRSANIQALTLGNVAWVRFDLSGTINRRSSDNTLPYAIAGNVGTDFYGPAPRPGDYTLKATPFYEQDGKIVQGKPETISFTFVGGASSTADMRAYPNVFEQALFLNTDQPANQVQVRLQSIQGQQQVVKVHQEAGRLMIDTQRVPAGHYILQVSSAEGTQTQHVVKE